MELLVLQSLETNKLCSRAHENLPESAYPKEYPTFWFCKKIKIIVYTCSGVIGKLIKLMVKKANMSIIALLETREANRQVQEKNTEHADLALLLYQMSPLCRTLHSRAAQSLNNPDLLCLGNLKPEFQSGVKDLLPVFFVVLAHEIVLMKLMANQGMWVVVNGSAEL